MNYIKIIKKTVCSSLVFASFLANVAPLYAMDAEECLSLRFPTGKSVGIHDLTEAQKELVDLTFIPGQYFKKLCSIFKSLTEPLSMIQSQDVEEDTIKIFDLPLIKRDHLEFETTLRSCTEIFFLDSLRALALDPLEKEAAAHKNSLLFKKSQEAYEPIVKALRQTLNLIPEGDFQSSFSVAQFKGFFRHLQNLQAQFLTTSLDAFLEDCPLSLEESRASIILGFNPSESDDRFSRNHKRNWRESLLPEKFDQENLTEEVQIKLGFSSPEKLRAQKEAERSKEEAERSKEEAERSKEEAERSKEEARRREEDARIQREQEESLLEETARRKAAEAERIRIISQLKEFEKPYASIRHNFERAVAEPYGSYSSKESIMKLGGEYDQGGIRRGTLLFTDIIEFLPRLFAFHTIPYNAPATVSIPDAQSQICTFFEIFFTPDLAKLMVKTYKESEQGNKGILTFASETLVGESKAYNPRSDERLLPFAKEIIKFSTSLNEKVANGRANATRLIHPLLLVKDIYMSKPSLQPKLKDLVFGLFLQTADQAGKCNFGATGRSIMMLNTLANFLLSEESLSS